MIASFNDLKFPWVNSTNERRLDNSTLEKSPTRDNVILIVNGVGEIVGSLEFTNKNEVSHAKRIIDSFLYPK